MSLSNASFAVTDFYAEVRNSGGDYSSLANAESAFDVNLTDAVVLSHGGITGTMADGGTATGQTSGATGTIAHVSSDQILIYGITGTFQNAEDICADSPTCSNKVTSSSAPDDGALVVTVYNDQTFAADFSWNGGTYDSVNTITIQGDTTGDSELAWDGTSSGGVKITATAGGWGAFRIEDTNATLKNFVFSCDSYNCVSLGESNGGDTFYAINIILLNGGFYDISAAFNYTANHINCVSIDSPADCIDNHYNYSGSTLTVYNMTCINPVGIGYRRENQTLNVYNSSCFGAGSSCYSSVSAGDYNACSDTTCNTFSNYEASLTMADELVDGGNGDIHLKAGSNLIDAGNDYSGTTGIGYDIDNVTRSGTWDIGADEYVRAATRNRMIMIE